jgi:hypothetical protein
MFLQPPPAAFDAWDLTNYRWSEPFLWIVSLASLFMGMFLFASYLKTRKKSSLLWTFGFLGIFTFYYALIGTGSWAMLAGAFGTDMFGLYTAMLLALIPGFFAAGLCYDKDKKLGMIYTIFVLLFSVAYLVILIAGNSKLIADYALIAAILLVVVQLPSAALIIALPLMKEGPLFPKNLLSIGGGFMVTTNIIMSLIMIMEALGAGLNHLEGMTIDKLLMIVPFFITIYILCLLYGIFGTKEYGFELPHVEFED